VSERSNRLADHFVDFQTLITCWGSGCSLSGKIFQLDCCYRSI